MIINPVLNAIIQLTIERVSSYDTNLYRLFKGTVVYALEEEDARVAINDIVSYGLRYQITPAQVGRFASEEARSIPMALMSTAQCLHDGLKSYMDYYQEISNYFVKTTWYDANEQGFRISMAKSQTAEEQFYQEAFIFQAIYLVRKIKPTTKIKVYLNELQLKKHEAVLRELDISCQIENHQIYGNRFEVSGPELFEINPLYDHSAFSVLTNFGTFIARPKTRYSGFIKRHLHSVDKPAAVRLSDIAQILKMSDRKLKRLLKEEGTTFSDLARDVIMARTLVSLASKKDIDEFSQDLGYSDRSGLAHLFKQVSGAPLSSMMTSVSRLSSYSDRTKALRNLSNIYPLDDTIIRITKLIADEDFSVKELANLINGDLGASTALTKLASSAYYAISAKDIEEIVIKLGPILSAQFVISSALSKTIDSTRIAVPIESIIGLPLAIAESLKAVGKPNVLGSATFFIPVLLFLVYDRQLNELEKGGNIDITHVNRHIYSLTKRTNLKISEIIRIVILGFGFPSVFTKNLTSAVVESETLYGDEIFAHVLGLAVNFRAQKHEDVNRIVGKINELHPELDLKQIPA